MKLSLSWLIPTQGTCGESDTSSRLGRLRRAVFPQDAQVKLRSQVPHAATGGEQLQTRKPAPKLYLRDGGSRFPRSVVLRVKLAHTSLGGLIKRMISEPAGLRVFKSASVGRENLRF